MATLIFLINLGLDKLVKYFERMWPVLELIRDLVLAFFENLKLLLYAGTIEELLSALMGLLPFIIIFVVIIALLKVAKYVIYFFSAILIGTIIIKLVQLLLFI